MNANEIWSGQDYAYVQYISRGVTYYERAKPVKILRVFKQKEHGSERARTMCEVMMLDEDEHGKLTPKMYGGKEDTRTVRARNIYARWYEHAQVRNKKREERAEQERKAQEERERRRLEYEERERRYAQERAERMERERIEREERERRQNEENALISAWFERRGLKSDQFSFTINGNITINRDVMLRKVGTYGQAIVGRA